MPAHRSGEMDVHEQRQHPEVEFVTIHGHRRAFVRLGEGPALLLLHGLGCDHTTWSPVIDRLAERFTVIAPDLLGHGQSAKPRADYSLGGYANAMRDLITYLGIDKVTVVGHSFGGGVAMQFAYQFPERTERMMLVAPGGFGPEVSPAIRVVASPGFHEVMGLLTLPGVRQANTAALRLLSRAPLRATRDLDEVADMVESFKDPHARAAIRRVVRSVVDWKGQIVTMADRAYLTEAMPMAVLWGRDDVVIPVRHASIVAALAPKARVDVLPDSGHFPHKDHPERFVELLTEFVSSSAPANYSRARWRRMLRGNLTAPVGPLASVRDITA